MRWQSIADLIFASMNWIQLISSPRCVIVIVFHFSKTVTLNDITDNTRHTTMINGSLNPYEFHYNIQIILQ